MGFLTSSLSFLSKIALFLLLVALFPGIPPHAEFEAYSLTPALPLEGALALNTKLNGAERILEGEVHGPEDLHVYNGQLYMTLHGGHVVRLAGDKVQPVVKFGQPCEGFHEEQKCGRPMGLTFDKKGKMYVADAYYGIYKVDVTTGKHERLVSINDTIEGKQPKIPNSVAVSSEGVVFWTDSSTTHHIHDGIFTCLCNGNGRLLKFNPTTKTNTVLVDKLNFPNGVAISNDESFLVVSETTAYRLLKYHLKGPKAGQKEVLLDGLPGMPDNINKAADGSFVVSLVIPRDPVLSAITPFPLVRKLLSRLLYGSQSTVTLVDNLYPHPVLKKTAHLIGHFEMLPPPLVKRTTILFVTREGKVSRSLHATDGLTSVSSFAELNGYYYLGSPFNRFLARVKAT